VLWRADVQATISAVANVTQPWNSRTDCIACATSTGAVVAFDERSNKPAWRMELPRSYGLIQSMTHGEDGCWLAVGTARGVLACCDLRYGKSTEG
jgi:hypothetical protein